MPIAPNTKFDHYEILAPLGKGGMGEVYTARDTRLDRAVAIKILPAEFAQDADRLRRFALEAKATSALNHANILTVYDFGTFEGNPYLVMELLDGEELRAQLEAGTLPVRKAIDYAQQIAAGLAAAHEKNLVHRDLKPENLFITNGGRVKILDFGLAKLTGLRNADFGLRNEEAETLVQGDPNNPQSPIRNPQLTAPGTIMGTVAYMSPEQVRGQDVDHRSDIFSFGIILYEMLSGNRAFTGESQVEVMNAILKEDPPELSTTGNRIPPQLDKIMRRCLEKKPELRFHSAHDLGFALSTLTTTSGSQVETAMALPALTESLPATKKAGLLDNARLWMAVAAVAMLVALAALPFAVKYLRQASPVEAVAGHFVIPAPEKVTALGAPELSPDGRHLVFATVVEGRRILWLRPLGSLTAQPLPGTEGVSGFPFWSPDSRSLGFFVRGELKKLDLAGGAPQMLCKLPADASSTLFGGTWNRDGIILFTFGGRIYRVAATGGEPTLVLGTEQSNREAAYRWPVFLPDGRHFLYLRTPTQQGASEIYLAALDGKEPTRLLAADSHSLYAASPMGATGSGYLLFARAGTLLAQTFDASSLKLAGEPFVVADKVTVQPNGRGMFSVSDNGSLAYDPTGVLANQQLIWVDRTGKPLEPVGAPGILEWPRLSPDGKRIAVARRDAQTGTYDIHVIDLARGTSSRLTFDPGDDRYPAWSPDGSRFAWAAKRGLYQKLASGVGPEELLLKSDAPSFPGSWSADGRFLLYAQNDPKTGGDLWVLPLEGERKPFLFLQTPSHEGWLRLSKDGRWIAYHSTDQGRAEVYVQNFPASGGQWQVSTNGGGFPQWRSDGKELFYLSSGKLMAVEVKPGNSFEAGVPKALFDLTPLRAIANVYAVAADGQRFLFVTQGEANASLQYMVVTNWTAEAKK